MKTRRTDILKASYDLMGTKGLESVHARSVAANLGINHATVHYYFPTRLDLLVGIADQALAQFQSDRERFLADLQTPADKLEGELALAEAYCKKNSRFAKVLAGLYVASIEYSDLKKKLQVLWKEWASFQAEIVPKSKLKANSPYNDGELLTATLFGFALAAHLTDGKFDGKSKIDEVFTSMFG